TLFFHLKYGIEVMESIGINPSIIRAGKANMFLSPVFRETLAGVTGARIELYDTDGAQGAALAGGVGAGVYTSFQEAFTNLKKLEIIEPDVKRKAEYQQAYLIWKEYLNNIINK
ncbi:MAG: carbohydrate kinase, partial [Bacteroidales bacterium]|nr:carbohydrate kinase [Bacteroidales bacterium]